ncbi:glycosyltransferase family 2 protein [Halpernia frigidisoli]|uniref:Glycosyltransferase involved in cell wall bisynthesis n=1 Tax=Halpernia frigidisoli TaxID=1125876 RepID=A0A1I3FEN7_9FLAO|nr:glycosyltransferase family 2 protein [Halpernia frigidisoli]SFI09656.1 Glycosyltransferase involved in cell wall bisynthesis [Halpernia frigidisoli]
MTKVSLITGCFNGEKFIPRCFASILSQTYNDLEVIFVDDGSTDTSLKLAETYREKFLQKGFSFKIVSQKNMGFYPQSGIKISTGKYITTLDIDDILLPGSIQKRVDFLEENPDFSAVRTNGAIVQENDNSKPISYFMDDFYESKNVFEDLLEGKTTNIPGTYMVCADILFKYYPDKIIPMNRFTQNLQILLPVTYQRKVGYIHEILMHYMRHNEAFTADKNDYFTTKKQYESFKEVRKSLLLRMNLLTSERQNKLDQTYNSIFLELAYKFNKKDEFKNLYKTLERPNFESRVKHALFSRKKLSTFLVRLEGKIKRRKH